MGRRALVLVVTVLCALGLVGCGGGDSSSATSTSSTTETTETTEDTETTEPDAGLGDTSAFTDCLAENGLELPEGGAGGGQPPTGGDGATMPQLTEEQQAAITACQDLAPEGGAGAGGGGVGGDSSALESYISCLTDNGVTVTDDDGDETTAPSIDQADPDFEAANEICQALLPTPSTTSTTTTAS